MAGMEVREKFVSAHLVIREEVKWIERRLSWWTAFVRLFCFRARGVLAQQEGVTRARTEASTCGTSGCDRDASCGTHANTHKPTVHLRLFDGVEAGLLLPKPSKLLG